jgi:hypothetical protein
LGVLGIETIFLFIGLFQSSTCNYITTTRGLTANIIVVSLLVLPLFYGVSFVIVKLVNMWREWKKLEKIQMATNIVEMSFASTGRVMNFYEDFYAVTIVSYIYYQKESQQAPSEDFENARNIGR